MEEAVLTSGHERENRYLTEVGTLRVPRQGARAEESLVGAATAGHQEESIG